MEPIACIFEKASAMGAISGRRYGVGRSVEGRRVVVADTVLEFELDSFEAEARGDNTERDEEAVMEC